MTTFNVLLGSINDVKNFVNIVSKYDYEIDLSSGRYVVDAKSIMGIFSLDLTKEIVLEIHKERSKPICITARCSINWSKINNPNTTIKLQFVKLGRRCCWIAIDKE